MFHRTLLQTVGIVALQSPLALAQGNTHSLPRLHHVGLNSVDPAQAIAWYLALWPSATRTTVAGYPAVQGPTRATTLAIVKTRGSDHDRGIHALLVGPGGLRIGPVPGTPPPVEAHAPARPRKLRDKRHR